MMHSRGMGKIAKAKKPKAPSIKKYNGDDESLVDEGPYIPGKTSYDLMPIAAKNSLMGVNSEALGGGASANIGSGRLSGDIVGAKMSRLNPNLQSEETYAKPASRLSYRQPVGDGGVSLSRIKQDKMRLKDLSGDLPIGEGRLMAGISEAEFDGHKAGRTRRLGYSTKLGPGTLDAMVMKPEGGSKSAQLLYRMPFSKGGKTKRKK